MATALENAFVVCGCPRAECEDELGPTAQDTNRVVRQDGISELGPGTEGNTNKRPERGEHTSKSAEHPRCRTPCDSLTPVPASRAVLDSDKTQLSDPDERFQG